MEIPETLGVLIKEANDLIKNHPNGELILPFRKRILREFGPIQQEGIPTIGTKRRTMLEIINIERLMYLWEIAVPEDRRPQIILDNIKKYFNQEIDRVVLREMFNSTYGSKRKDIEFYQTYDLWVACENYMYNDQENLKNYMIGFCVCKIRGLALNDIDICDSEKLDLDYDSYDTQVSYDISCLDAPFPWDNSSHDTIQKRRNYWLWYVNEAVPNAYNLYK